MVSRLPTPSIKYMKLQRQHRILAGIVFAGLAALLILWPWATLSGGLIIYVASIPFAVFAHHPRYATRRGH
jgi:phosphatidylserine synthase